MQKVIILAVLVSLIGFYQVDTLMCYSCALCTYPIASSASQITCSANQSCYVNELLFD